MSYAVQTPQVRKPRPAAPLTVVPSVEEQIETTEMHRWLLWVSPTFVAAALFFALAIATGTKAFIGFAVVLGPIAMMFSFIYLCVSSDSNGRGWHSG